MEAFCVVIGLYSVNKWFEMLIFDSLFAERDSSSGQA